MPVNGLRSAMSGLMRMRAGRSGRSGGVLATAWRLLASVGRRHPLRLVAVFVSQVVVGIFENIGLLVLLPLLQILLSRDAAAPTGLSRWLADALTWLGVPMTLAGVLLFMIAVITVKAALKMSAQILTGLTVHRENRDLRLDLVRRIVLARWRFFLRQPAGGLANTLGGEMTNAVAALAASVELVSRSIQVALYLASSLLVSWRLTLGGLLVGLFIMGVLRPILDAIRGASHERTKLMNMMSGRIVEALAGMKALKSMHREGHVLPLLESESERIYKTQATTVIGQAIRTIVPEPMLVIALAGGVYVAVEFYQIGFPALALVAVLFLRITNELATLNKYLHQIASFEGAVAVVERVLAEARAEEEHIGGGARPSLARGISLRDVTVRYGDKVVLESASLDIPAHRITVITGPSGSGKTTILDCIVGFVRPAAGQVTVDGVGIEVIDLAAWRRMIGYVPQDLFLFNDTIEANITLGNRAISREDVLWALDVAEARDFVEALPEGLATMAGERGMTLSGGQRQRLSIARAIVARPKLLLLDEATSALDPVTERDICRTVRALRDTFTVLAVSHQPAILDVCDVAYEIRDGRPSRLALEGLRQKGAPS